MTRRIVLKESIARLPWLEVLCALAFACILHRPGLQAWGEAIPGQGDAIRAHWSAWVVAAEFPRWTLHTTFADFRRASTCLLYHPLV